MPKSFVKNADLAKSAILAVKAWRRCAKGPGCALSVAAAVGASPGDPVGLALLDAQSHASDDLSYGDDVVRSVLACSKMYVSEDGGEWTAHFSDDFGLCGGDNGEHFGMIERKVLEAIYKAGSDDTGSTEHSVTFAGEPKPVLKALSAMGIGYWDGEPDALGGFVGDPLGEDAMPASQARALLAGANPKGGKKMPKK